MGTFLLDANVLVALSWPTHSAHDSAQRWFGKNSKQGWATCPLTQCAFVRIVSNPAFSPHALSPRDALNVLSANLKHPAHHFWPDNVDLLTALRAVNHNITGHRQITDAYLVGLAIQHKGKLATLDHGVPALGADIGVELIG